jgi:hypothetical protein
MKSDHSMGGGGGWPSAAKDGEAIPVAKARARAKPAINERGMIGLLLILKPY